ncbi:MAG: PilZ domain-containing protein [Candidatus Solibacter usitatus]|nr:PilZ domain-containing protein [Candidatus Solibacter usitatus]
MFLKHSISDPVAAGIERRKEPRLECRRPARLLLLSTGEARDGMLLDVSGRGARFLLADAIPTGIAVRVDVGEQLLLGDVVYCRKETEGFMAGVDLSHTVFEAPATA